MEGQILVNPRLTVERLAKALNAHDLEGFADCFDPLYLGEEPIHPDRAFRGRERAVSQWQGIFKKLPDFKAKIISNAVEQDTVWTEWHWHGTRQDKRRVELRGVTILGIRDGRIVWGRVYMEPSPGASQGLGALVI